MAALTPQRLAQLKSMFMDYGWRSQQKAAGNGGLEYLDPESGMYIVPQFTTRQGAGPEDQIEEISGFSTYDSNHPLAKLAREKKDNFYNKGMPLQGYDAQGNFIKESLSEGGKKNSAMDYLLPAAMLALPFGAAIAGAGAGAAGGATGLAGAGDAGLMYAGADAAAAGSLGGGASVAGGSALGAGELAALGSGGAGALGAGGIGGVPPPANPFAPGVGSGGGILDGIKSAAGSLLPGSGSGGFDWGSLIGPATQLIGGAIGSNAAKGAADAQLTAVREAQALQEPFRQGGLKGLNRLLDLYGLSGNTSAEGYGSVMRDFGKADFEADPGYQFRQEEGERGLQRAASAQGGIGSGKFLKDAMRFNQGLASQEYGNAFNRYQVNRTAKINPLQSLMGSGQTAATTLGDYATQGGNAAAAGKVGQANAWTNALSQGVGMYQNNRQMDQNNALMRSVLERRF